MRLRSVLASCALCALLVSLSAGASPSPSQLRGGRNASEQLAVTLEVSAAGGVSLAGVSRLAGRPQMVRDVPAERDFTAVLETERGVALGTVAFDDPTRLRAEWSPDGHRIAGEEVRLPSATVVVRFRHDPGAGRVRVLRADPQTEVRSKARPELPASPALRTVGVFDLNPSKVAGLAPPPPYTTETIVDNGPSENRLDIVFLGDGYTSSQLSQFRRDVLDVVDQFEAASPYDRFMPLINVHMVNVVSNESGIDDPEANVSRDTALDLSFNIGGTQRCVYTESAYKVYAAAALVPEYDAIFVIANDPQYGGCGGNFACFTTDPTAGEIAIHEFGHSFGLLADEYGGDSRPPRREPVEVNVTRARTLKKLQAAGKWRYWVPQGQQIPTPAGTTGVGLFEGAAYSDTRVYRPVDNCRMRVLGVPYCPICREQLTRRLHAYADPVESFSSSPGPDSADPRTVVSVADPAGDVTDPSLDVRAVEIVQEPQALRLSIALEGPVPDADAETDAYYVFELSNASITADVFFLVESRKIYLSLPDGSTEDLGVADFGGSSVSGRVPLDRLGNPTSLSWLVVTASPSTEGGEALDGPAFSLVPLDRVVIDAATAFSAEGTHPDAPGATYATRWLVDGVEAASGSSFATTGAQLGSGLHTVRFEVAVSTPLVRLDPQGLLESSRELTVAVCGTGPRVVRVMPMLDGNGAIEIDGSGLVAGTTVQVNGLALRGDVRIEERGAVLVQSGPLSNGLPLGSVLRSGEPASVLVVAPSGDCSATSVTP